ncbi:unnamed protein product [Soboliphyme baturini]|uniref:Ubiquitin carboxyl-terminal hydrolase 36 n=1 Tax=Soboliphyme baturini TaxID=241478 RepID=A0A183II92_9BILA|nr:unnamed protein product [Soboliphyme baturini]
MKTFTIHKAPSVLTLHLKRFNHTGKIDRRIFYPEKLDLRPITNAFRTCICSCALLTGLPAAADLSISAYGVNVTLFCFQGPPALYELYAVLVHQGQTPQFGHYFVYVKNAYEQWHRLDDEHVRF